MSELNRRNFLLHTSLGASALGLLADQRPPPAHPAAQDSAAPADPLAPHTTMMLHVRDAATGEVALFVDHREIVFRDVRLVARLLSAAHSA